jgi:branched-chain amino acid transport system ATP-binding protein
MTASATTPVQAAALEVKDLVVGYGRLQVVRGVSMLVPPCTVVALIGGNGAGTSTVLNAIAGLVRPQSGQVVFNGTDLTGWPAHRVARAGLVIVPQGRQMIAPLTVLENLEMGAYTRKDGDIAGDIRQMLVRFPRLGDRQAIKAGLLSGGEQQVLAIARALMSRPKMIVMDEPSVGLSPAVLDEVFRIIRDIASSGVPILVVEQNAIKAMEVSDFCYVLQTGQIVQSGRSRELKSDPRIISAYLGY